MMTTRDDEVNRAFLYIARERIAEIAPGSSQEQLWTYGMTPYVGSNMKQIQENIKISRFAGEDTDILKVCGREKCQIYTYDKAAKNVIK